ncbi:hypothetical protein BKA65DRAFT_197968 [Rhexocercosporidium sp. MPI-PUGE-AT-0058]|nr:hypothetical protein BKA65DRAFT_197968 [Rhexocercosporidium sp. MPI-PUGE-AT-0058]
MSTHEILILGGHHAGINVAHYLLRHVIPKLANLTPSTSYHVTIITPNVEFYWNIAAPRLIVSETLVPEEKVFLPIAKAFASYDAAQFKFVKGKATALDPEKRSVSISNGEKLTYDSLVIATGAYYASPVWQLNESEEHLKSEISALRKSLVAAKTVLIAGGGAIGVETAGEIGAQFPKHDTTILSGNSRLLPRLLPSNSSAAESRLKALGVKTVNDVKLSSTRRNADGTTTVALSDGSSRTVDVFIDATGGKPNSTFLPSAWLNESGRVITDDKTMRTDKPGIYAIGDVASYSSGSIVDAQSSVAPLGTSIGIDLAKAAGKEGLFTQKEFKPIKDTQFVPTGPSGGVGQLMGWKLPSLMVWAAKSRTYFVSMAQGALEGGNVKKP